MFFLKNSNLFLKAALAALVGVMCFSCTKHTPEPEPGVDWGTTTIASVLDSKVGETFELKAVVAGVNEKGVILQQDGEDRRCVTQTLFLFITSRGHSVIVKAPCSAKSAPCKRALPTIR